MLNRLRMKFIAVNMGIVLAMLAVIFGLVIHSTRQNLERDSLGVLRSALSGRELRVAFDLEGAARGGRAEPEGEGQTDPERRREPPEDLPGVSLPYLRVQLDTAGNIESYDSFLFDFTDSQDRLSELVDAVMDRQEDFGELEDAGLRYLRDRTPMGTRLAFADMSVERSTLRDLLRSSLLIGGASVAVFFAISLLLARWAVKPVEAAWKQQKQFVSDASHELKTPLTVIMTNAELLQSPDYDAPAKARFAANVLTMSRQMRGLVESLLELARVDNGAVATASKELDLSRLCADALLPFEPLYFEKGLTLESHITPGVRVKGSESYLRQVVEILLDNAQKYALPASDVRVTLDPAGRQCRLCVSSAGPEIPEEDRRRLFERFYRADKARGRDGSFGLGLSIAQKIVESHRGKIWVESRDGRNSFYISLPTLA